MRTPPWMCQCCQDVPRSHFGSFLLPLPSAITSSGHLFELCLEWVLRKQGHEKRGPLRWGAWILGFTAASQDPSAEEKMLNIQQGAEGEMVLSVSAFGPCPPRALSNFLTSLPAPFCLWWGEGNFLSILISAGSEILEFPWPLLQPHQWLLFRSFIQWNIFTKACGVPGTVLDAENKAVNKASKDACLCGACLLGGRQAGKETDNYKMNMEET